MHSLVERRETLHFAKGVCLCALYYSHNEQQTCSHTRLAFVIGTHCVLCEIGSEVLSNWKKNQILVSVKLTTL